LLKLIKNEHTTLYVVHWQQKLPTPHIRGRCASSEKKPKVIKSNIHEWENI